MKYVSEENAAQIFRRWARTAKMIEQTSVYINYNVIIECPLVVVYIRIYTYHVERYNMYQNIIIIPFTHTYTRPHIQIHTIKICTRNNSAVVGTRTAHGHCGIVVGRWQ